MGYRNIYVSNFAKLSVKNEQLIIVQDVEKTVPLEDVNCIVIEEQGVIVTAYTLLKFADFNIAAFICDKKHLPTSIVMPVNQHFKRLNVLTAQIEVKKPVCKKLWQSIIKQKIINQAECLEIVGVTGSDRLLRLSESVLSGDTTNNAGLNYGYAIIRGVIARTLCAYGFEPSIGIFHHNQLNNFNLADDLIEPFRPLVDLYVATYIMDDYYGELDRENKLGLYNLISFTILSGDQKHSVSYAIDRMVQNLLNCFLGKEKVLVLPKLLPLKLHEYE